MQLKANCPECKILPQITDSPTQRQIPCTGNTQAYTCKRHILIQVLPVPNAYTRSANAYIHYAKSFCYFLMHICIFTENFNQTLNVYTWYIRRKTNNFTFTFYLLPKRG